VVLVIANQFISLDLKNKKPLKRGLVFQN